MNRQMLIEYLETQLELLDIRRRILSPIHVTMDRVKRLYKWIPVLWNIYDFDYTSLLVVMQFQMKQLSKDIREGMSKNGGQYADEIDECIEILDQLLEGWPLGFVANELKKHEDYWGKSEMIQVPNKEDHFTIGCPKAIKEDREEEELEAKRAIYELGHQREKEAYEKLFGIMKERVPFWWD